MRKRTKKGFTLVELLVVIAILAILASVSVVGYLGFTKRANLSNDQTTIAMLNRNLQAEFVSEKPTSASETIQKLYSIGVNSGKLKAYSKDYHYAYHLEKNMFFLLDDNDEVVFPENETINKEDLWGLYSNISNDAVGLSKYVALKPVVDDEAFSTIYNQSLTIDLNHFYFGVSEGLSSDKIITLLNGGVITDGSSIDSNIIKTDDTVIPYKKVDEKNLNTINNSTLNDGYVFDRNVLDESIGDSTKDFTFKNCLFVGVEGEIKTTNFLFYAKNLTFENCIITNTIWMQSAPSESFTVRNCKFVGSVSGINVQNPTKVLIENNVFDLLADDSTGKSSAIMLSPTKDDKTYDMVVRGNDFVNCGTIIRLHSCGYTRLGTIDTSKIQFSNNSYGFIKDDTVEEWVDGTVTQDVIDKINELKKVIK